MASHKNLGLRAFMLAVGSIGALGAFSSSGHATIVVDPNKYCSAGADKTTNFDTSTDTPKDNLSTSDVTLTITGPAPQYTASDCYGDFATANSDPSTTE